MLAVLLSSAIVGIDGKIIKVEVDVSRGMPSFNIVGLPDTSVRESRERVISAIKNSGFDFPAKKITINLAPADIKKEGSSFDLAMALGILVATEQINKDKLIDHLILGELSLSGTIRKVKGILPSVLAAKKHILNGVFIPADNSKEASIVDSIKIYPMKSLKQASEFCNNSLEIEMVSNSLMEEYEKISNLDKLDFNEVKGQSFVKRAMEVAAAGGHNILMIGPPGSGKTMLAKRLPTILPKMSLDEALETTKIHSVAGILPKDVPLLANRPFRTPHHTISDIALIGGGSFPRPGEVSLAHNGVLFLDELPEFKRNVLEVLRQPLEEGKVIVSRAAGTLVYPSNIMFVSAMNPCPCGYYGSQVKECTCKEYQIQRYLSKISGPLWDRMDLHIEVPQISYEDLVKKEGGENSRNIRDRVCKTRETQKNRFLGSNIYTNSNMGPKEIKKYCVLNRETEIILKKAIDKFNLSARAYDRILKVARTIADLDKSESIESYHLTEAIQYRMLDKNWWLI